LKEAHSARVESRQRCGDVFGVEIYIACQTEGANDKSAVDSVWRLKDSSFHESGEAYDAEEVMVF